MSDRGRLRAERMAPDVVALLPGAGASGTATRTLSARPLATCRAADRSGRLHPDDRAGPTGGNSVVPADAPAELRLAAKQTTLTDHDAGAAAELLYGMVRAAEKFA
ncbi:hypothetical protein [Faecalibacterium hattorii]|uniref:hypothetical protein n=1 Tax=Faecalibacterium hattorii TaxID=2935520 RepID=UPI003AB0848E